MEHRTNPRSLKIALIGVEFEENLSLRYLGASLKAAGYHDIKIQAYNSILEAEEIAESIIREDVDLVGVSMAFQVRAIDDMAIVELLRKRGFDKHITAGGQFASLHFNEIFEDCRGLSSIIRFEAEEAILSLADSLASKTELKKVPGLIWKDAQQQIHINNVSVLPSDIDELASPLRKAFRASYLGLKTSQMVGSRGCHATCKYCCVSALATERRTASRESGNRTALAGTRRRSALNIAAEIAHLYFEHDIRIFEFQDDNWIHPKKTTAVAYFTDLKEALKEKGVGQIGLTLKTRADSVQPEILKVLKEIGLIRVFVGIESGTQNLLSKLGRKSRDNVSITALKTLRAFNIPAYFNALLFGPDIRFGELDPELEFLSLCTDFPFEIVEVVIYGKTGLYLELKKEERLHGNYLDYEYDYLDDRTQDIHHIISKLETRHFGVYSPVKMAADLGFNLGILQVFHPGKPTEQLAKEVKRLTQRINTDQIQAIRTVSEYVVQGLGVPTIIKVMVAQCLSSDLQFYGEIIQLQRKMEEAVSANTKQKVSAYYRAGAMVQSGLLASLFLLSMNTASAQNAPSIDSTLKSEMVQLIYDFNAKDWQKVKEQLKDHKSPISEYLFPIGMALDSIPESSKPTGVTEFDQNLKKFNKKFAKLQNDRIKEDFDRLKNILNEHLPKIKIASSLDIYLDDAGYVRDVRVISFGKKGRVLSPDLKVVILNLLKEKQFYAYESRKRMIVREPKLRHRERYFKKRMRTGPLD